jgi:phosphate transport system ATP-binding protein
MTEQQTQPTTLTRVPALGRDGAEQHLRPQGATQGAILEDIPNPTIEVRGLSLWYGHKQALTNVSFKIPRNKVTALIGPSGCGKSTLLRCFNRMNDLIPNVRIEGKVYLDGQDIYDRSVDPVEVRRRVGMVFQKPNPFPRSIKENILFGAKVNGFKGDKDRLVEESLRGRRSGTR